MQTILRLCSLLFVLCLLATCGDDSGGASSSSTADQDSGACESGTLGCTCAAGSRCGNAKDGSRLTCQAGICQPMSCSPGAPGCGCKLGSQCDKGAECKAGFCQPKNCERGSLNCGCLGGTCDPGLYCTSNQLCADASGHEGGACLKNGSCLQGSRCDASLATCVACELGSEGCQCTAAHSCNAGLGCSADLCVSAALIPPKNPRCYTPCLQQLQKDKDARACDSDGLLEGCIAGKECKQGSCVEPGMDAPSCESDSSCPFFQTCLQGRCYSTCEQNADCPMGLGCYRKVCRVPCDAKQGGAACPAPMSCAADDGQLGFCSPYVPSSDTSTGDQSTEQGGLTLTAASLELDNLHPDRRVRVQNGSQRRSDVVVHKLWHLVHLADGTSQRVDTPRDPSTGEFKDCDASRGQCPLDWLELSIDDQQGSRARKLEFGVPAACSGDTCPSLRVNRAGSGPGVRWEGELLVTSSTGTARLALSYSQTPAGRWSGSLFYLGNFPQQGLSDWVKGSDKGAGDVAKNALIQIWSAFRRGALDDWREMLAVLTATRTESFKFDRVKELCSALTNGSGTAVCYPHGNPAGVRVYAQNANNFPVPSGVTELPIALQLRADDKDASLLTGVIDSRSALQYPARPRVQLRFNADPGAAGGGCDGRIKSDCAVFLSDFSADIALGGRYLSPDGKCASGYEPVTQPWLLDDFVAGTASGARTECRSSQLPYAPDGNAHRAQNLDLSAANPAPDGVTRTRKLRLLDGALVNQTDLVVLFEETFPSFLPGQSASEVKAYGFMLLSRDPRELQSGDYDPGASGGQASTAPASTGPSCSSDLIARVGGNTPDTLVNTLLKGRGGSSDYTPISGNVYAHYLCEETGVFDNGRVEPGSTSAGLGCPVGSAVTYFLATTASLNDEPCQKNVQCDVELKAVDGGVSNIGGASTIAASGLVVKCKTPGTCKSQLNEWVSAKKTVIERDPLWQCASGSYCDGNRFDLREGKTFYRYTKQDQPPVPLAPLRTAIDQAFRYKSRFISDTGQNVGFAPQVCQPGSDQVPYCYDPRLIEDVRARIDCLLSIYTDQVDALPAQTRADLEAFLRSDFSQFEAGRDGFERLYGELLTMLGDEAQSSSFASRFDLAASSGKAFAGSELERGGVDLSGVAGFELYQLYRGIQYYQLGIDRMYGLGKQLAMALSRGATSSPNNFVSPETVTLYLERLAGASAKKARAWDEVTKRYLSLGRADLARAVVEREYVRTYMESVLLGQLMTQITDVSRNANKDQLRQVIEQTQRGYRMALLGMTEVYRSIDDSTTVFGFAPDYIPFPALDAANINDTNAFEVLAAVANRKIDAATAREEAALGSARSTRTDAASFQAELVRVRNTYEDQLSELCGTFSTDDGRVLPATDKYASLSEPTRLMGDPCGRVGNGQIKDAYVTIEDARAAQRGVSARAQEIISEIDIERERVSRQCKLNSAVADYEFARGTERLKLSKKIADARYAMGVVQRTTDTLVQGASTMANCDGPVGCVSAGLSTAVIVSALTASNITASLAEKQINEHEQELGQLELSASHWVSMTQCDAALIDSDARTRTLALGLAQTEIELLRANLQVNLAAGNMQRLLNQAKRLRGQQREAEQMLINVEAARNDPNVRVYKNDAILNADFSFDDALRAAYRATRVFEYYTSQSYAAREQLYLVRMAGAGQYNLQNYMQQLQNAFADFEEQYGVPDTRVMVLSLRDDILKIPLLDAKGDPYSREERISQLRERLRDPALLDASGRLVIPFGISVQDLSPVTRNHKVRYVELDVVGSDVGDTLGRLYLEQAGTGTIKNLSDSVDYYAFPERLSVINSFFNGSRVYGPEVYRSSRLRDRPAANSLWKLTINQRDEAVNKDINLQSLSDIRLLVYYDDFTKL